MKYIQSGRTDPAGGATVLRDAACNRDLAVHSDLGKTMFKWLRRRRLSANGRKRLLLLSARAEEAVVETHVANLIELLDTLADEVDFDRGIELYVEMMSLDESLTAAVTNRVLARLESPPAPDRETRFRDVFRDR